MPPAQKKRKVEAASGGDSLFDEQTFSPESVRRFAKENREGEPYAHVVVPKLFREEGVRQVVEEARTQLEATFKETDLFKMYQTLDLANFGDDCADEKMRELRTKVPGIVKLRDTLYSDRFRAFVRSVCGIEAELAPRVDMAMQAYSRGGHLMCHDDVIGTRAVSFIIYLTDPDEAWVPEFGGDLELYGLLDGEKKSGRPSDIPVKCVPPTSNSMVLFKVVPGVTYHAVAETLTDEIPRLSLQGWFHAAAQPDGAETASSISILKGKRESPVAFAPLPGVAEAGPAAKAVYEDPTVTEEEWALLKAHISSEYTTPKAWERIRAKFAETGSVQLRGFLKKDKAAAIQQELDGVDGGDNVGEGRKLPYTTGVNPDKGFHLVGPPVIRRYVKVDGSGLQLEGIAKGLMSSVAFTKLIAKLSGVNLLGKVQETRRFRAGADYTVAHHGLLEPDTRLDTNLCFVKESDGWITGDVGGFECFIAAESSDLVAAETYGNGDDAANDLLSLEAVSNTFSIVARDEQMMRFTKYVSAFAPGSRWDIAASYEIECDDDDEEDEEGDEEDDEKPEDDDDDEDGAEGAEEAEEED
ncbi:Prolyl 3 [Diplonema papillatum]|nr:Prolyl 3 [Diplonema papillatum]